MPYRRVSQFCNKRKHVHLLPCWHYRKYHGWLAAGNISQVVSIFRQYIAVLEVNNADVHDYIVDVIYNACGISCVHLYILLCSYSRATASRSFIRCPFFQSDLHPFQLYLSQPFSLSRLHVYSCRLVFC